MASESEVDRMVVRLMGDGMHYQAMLMKASAQTAAFTQRVSASMLRVGATMRTMGSRMSLYVTAPLVAMGALSVRAFANFDQAMVQSTSIMKTTEEQASRMRKVALDLSSGGQAVQSAKDLAKSYFFLASAGKDAEQSMALLPAVAQFATAGAFDMALATDLLTDAQSALGLSTKDVVQDTENMARVSDVLVMANTLANASVEQFSVALTSKAGAAMKSFGIDVEEGVAVLAAFADQGIKAELAGNGLGRVIRLLTKSALDNSEAHKALGFSVFDEAGEMRNLGDIIGNLETVLHGMSDEQKVATLNALGFEARIQQVILPLIGTSKSIKEYEAALREAGGTTQEVADKQLKSFANQMKIVWNQITRMAISVGELLAPAVSWLAKGLVWITKVWGHLSKPVKIAILVFSGLVASVGPLLFMFGGLISMMGFVISGFGAIAAVLPAVIAFITPLLPMIGAITAGLLAVAGALLLFRVPLMAAVGFFRDQLNKILGYFKPVIDGIGKELRAGNIRKALAILTAAIKLEFLKAWSFIVQRFAEPLNHLINGFSALRDAFRSIWKSVAGFISDTWHAMNRFIMETWTSTVNYFGIGMGSMSTGFSTNLKGITQLWLDFNQWFSNLWLSTSAAFQRTNLNLQKQVDRLVTRMMGGDTRDSDNAYAGRERELEREIALAQYGMDQMFEGMREDSGGALMDDVAGSYFEAQAELNALLNQMPDVEPEIPPGGFDDLLEDALPDNLSVDVRLIPIGVEAIQAGTLAASVRLQEHRMKVTDPQARNREQIIERGQEQVRKNTEIIANVVKQLWEKFGPVDLEANPEGVDQLEGAS